MDENKVLIEELKKSRRWQNYTFILGLLLGIIIGIELMV